MRVVLSWLAVTITVAVAVAVPWTCVVTGTLNADPLLGHHAGLLCPHICAGCRGPYQFPSTDQGHRVHCTGPDSRLSPASAVPGQEALIAATMIPAVLPAGLVAAAVLALRRRKRAPRS